MTLGWIKEPLTETTAKEIRKAVRISHDRGIDGHWFDYEDLRTIWRSGDHVVITHMRDPSWQYWRRDVEGWAMIGHYRTRREAQVTAEGPRLPRPGAKPRQLPPGWHVIATWAEEPYAAPERAPMRVPTRSEAIAKDIADVFGRLGCTTEIDLVK